LGQWFRDVKDVHPSWAIDLSIEGGLPLPPHKGSHASIVRFPGLSIYNVIKCRFNYLGTVPLKGRKRLEIGKEALKMLFSQ